MPLAGTAPRFIVSSAVVDQRGKRTFAPPLAALLTRLTHCSRFALIDAVEVICPTACAVSVVPSFETGECTGGALHTAIAMVSDPRFEMGPELAETALERMA